MIDPARIAAAASAIDPVFLNSPQLAFPALSEALGLDLTVKVETLNPIRSFKGRGTGWLVHELDDATPLVTASAGNFGQGLAYAARSRAVPVTVFAAETANPMKLERMRRLGAEVVLAGRDFDAAKEAARAHAEQRGHRFVEDGCEREIAEGAGTLALELLSGQARFDSILVPVGNGSLIIGIGSWMKEHSPATQVIGVCAAGAPSMARSWRSGRVETTATADTIADGIAARVPVPQALAEMQGVVDDMLLVEDRQIIAAMRLLVSHTGLVVEPAGAAGLAALLADPARFRGQRVATPLCGGNVTEEQFQRWFLTAAHGLGPA
ncbi:MAG TPA: pyridoxal-phosphate dependent enzyme [Alphaproteobacteria bacterium]